jgi:hypothetical protein
MDEIVDEVELDHSPIPSGCLRRLDEITIKKDGQIWRIHKNNDDPFPSNPHAHNLESRLKLDLSNGKLYYKRRDTGKAISSKDLLAIRSKITKIQLPPITT